jgi:acyl-CoA reductase-like NAD-dependent aldehyde dehydrogenase
VTTVSSTTLLEQQIWTGKIFNGDWITPTGGQYPVIEPATGTQLGVVGRASLDDVRRAADQAAEAQKAWARTSFNVRARVLRRAGLLWEQHAAEVREWLIRESGSTAPKAAFEQHMTPMECYEAAAIATQPYGHLLRSEEPRLSFARRLPVSVVSVITPFNSPLILSIRAVAPALVLGNAVLFEPDPRTSVSGSVALDDVDLDRAVAAGAWGSFFHQGQICMSTSRHLVHERIVDDYVERLSTFAKRLTVGDPAKGQVELGPIIDERQRDKVHDLVTSSVKAGARLAAGGTFHGLFYRPTVLSEVTPTMPISVNEIFGPVAPVVTFSTLEEAAALARDTEYGLSVAILSRDVMKAMELAEHIPSGLVHINDQTISDEPVAPIGGVGISGNGSRLGGAEWNIEAFTETQWVTVRGQIAPHPL